MGVLITYFQLKTIAPQATQGNIDRLLLPLNETLDKYNINTRLRTCSFIAQIAHESGNFQFLKELASGKAYEGRTDLGNIHPGDGIKYKGRGLIQLTGLFNYEKISKDLDIDFVNNPELLETVKYATLSAGWYWNKHNLNILADKNDFIGITKAINGGVNGLSKRTEYYQRALKEIK